MNPITNINIDWKFGLATGIGLGVGGGLGAAIVILALKTSPDEAGTVLTTAFKTSKDHRLDGKG